MKKLEKINVIVEYILLENEDARNNDDILYMHVCEHFDENVSAMSFRDFFKNRNTTNCPSFESVSRARRKVFSVHPELKPEKTTKYRDMKESEYREFYSN